MSSLINAVKVVVLSVATYASKVFVPHGSDGTTQATTRKHGSTPASSDGDSLLPQRFATTPFPQEIIDAIVDYLHDDKAVLAACACACLSFRRPCQKLL